jgi:hypothetical protein
MTVEGRFAVGDLAVGMGETITVTVSVLGPSWTRADRVELFANGVRIHERAIEGTIGAVEKAKVTWVLPRPAHDVSLVAIASGPGVTGPYWAIPKPYQPTTKVWEPRVLGATNPIRIDADDDGRYTSPLGYARSVIERTGTDPEKLLPALTGYDEAVAVQAAGLCQAAGRDVRDEGFVRALRAAAAPAQRGFAALTEMLSR